MDILQCAFVIICNKKFRRFSSLKLFPGIFRVKRSSPNDDTSTCAQFSYNGFEVLKPIRALPALYIIYVGAQVACCTCGLTCTLSSPVLFLSLVFCSFSPDERYR